jgi:2-iminobutanoate/2-iminopropanoate deaminase
METNANIAANAESAVQTEDFVQRVRVNQAKLASELRPHYDFIVCGSGSFGFGGNAPALRKSGCYALGLQFISRYWLKRFLIVPFLSTFALLTPTVSLAQQPTTMSAKSVAKLPFSPGLELGDTLYVSGHLGVDPAVGKAPDDPEEEARQVLHSVELTLKDAGMSMDDLVYVEIYCTDLKLYGAFNKAYASTLKSPYPARDFIGVKDLLFGAHFEVMGIAVRNASQNKRQPLAVK